MALKPWKLANAATVTGRTKMKKKDDNALFKKAIRLTKSQQELVLNTLIRVDLIEDRIKALQYAVRGLQSQDWDNHKGIADPIVHLLRGQQARAYKDLFSMALLFPELQAEAKRRIQENYFPDDGTNVGLMHLLDRDGNYPGSYRTADEKDLRANIRAALNMPLEEPEVDE